MIANVGNQETHSMNDNNEIEIHIDDEDDEDFKSKEEIHNSGDAILWNDTVSQSIKRLCLIRTSTFWCFCVYQSLFRVS